MTEETFWTTKRTGELDAKLDPKLTAQRQAFGAGQGGRKLTYLEGHAAIAQLNRLFGYGGWSYSVDEMGVDEYTQGPPEGWYAGFWATVTLRVGGVMRQDVGCVEVQNTGKGGAVRDNVHNVDSRSTARKGAVTDALKRAARTFGQQLGNGLYDVDDDVYAWMTAHSLDAEEGDAPTEPVTPKTQAAAKATGATTARAGGAPVTAPVPQPAAHAPTPGEDVVTGRPNAERHTPHAAEELPRSAADWTGDQLRSRIEEKAGGALKTGPAWKALARDHGVPEPTSAAQLGSRTWLLGLYQAMRAAEYQEMIASVDSHAPDAEDRVSGMVAEALSERDRRCIGMAHYDEIWAKGEARKAELSAPLLSGPRAQVAS